MDSVKDANRSVESDASSVPAGLIDHDLQKQL